LFQLISLPDLQVLKLCDNLIDDLNAKLFTSNKKLQLLSLALNDIELLAKNVFSPLSNLTVLSLSDNNIERIKVTMFRGLINLKALWLDCNGIKVIEKNSFDSTISLEFLSISENKLIHIDVDMFRNLQELVILKLNNNQLKRLDSGLLEHLESLAYLDMSNNKIQSIDVIQTGPYLSYIDLSKNQFKYEPVFFEKCDSLETLYVYMKGINEIDYTDGYAEIALVEADYDDRMKGQSMAQQLMMKNGQARVSRQSKNKK
jgi:Leucine-rich repeat (LRR) protein